MIKVSKRAIRRHHYQRLKRKRRNYWYGHLTDKHLGIVANTPRVCSCPLCGNPRRHWNEMTVQEKRQDYPGQRKKGKHLQWQI